MKRDLLVFTTALGISACIGLFVGGCWFDDCECLKTPARPEPQAPLHSLQISSFTASGDIVDIGLRPENGTFEVTGDAVLIRYRQDGAEHRVQYDVVGPR